MALDNRYIPDISLSEFLIDPETGLPIGADGNPGMVEFWQDENRSQPKNVFQLTGSPPNYTYSVLPNPMDVVNGIPVNENGENVAIYYYPYDELGNIQNYYIVVKNGEGVIVDEREAWPNLTPSDDPTQTENSITNELDNSQFVEVLFEPDYGLTITTDGAVSGQLYEIAPRWYLKVSSNATASIVINRTSLEGSLNIDTNPPYQLEITPEGTDITSLALVQRLEHNPDIWANGYVAASLVATSLDGINHTIEGIYSPNIAAAATTIFSETTGVLGYVRMSGTVSIPPGTNTDSADTGYVDFIVNLPPIGSVAVTSVQVVGLETDQQNVVYDQQPVNRQESLLFSYYNPLIQQVPVPSLTQGWDFKVNPHQFASTVALGAIASSYVWDQTIIWQSVNSSTTASIASPQALNVTTSTTNQFALIQYMQGAQLRQLLSNDFSVLIKALTNLTDGASGTVSVWVTSDGSLPNVATGTNLSLISTIDANGKPATFHGNWTEIPRNYRGEARFTIPFSAEMSEISLEGWNRTLRAADATYTFGAIVVGFESADAHSVVFDSIAITPGLLARPFAPLSYSETLLQMQFYYQKSYGDGVYAGASTAVDCLTRPQIIGFGTPDSVYATAFSFEYQQMRTNPLPFLYAQDGTINTVTLVRGQTVQFNVATSDWSNNINTKSAQFYPITGVIQNAGGGMPSIQFHYTLDARLGVV